MWSGLHASPGDAVEMFKDLRARRAVGMHWGCVPFSSLFDELIPCVILF